jgi:hypothetical protein
MGQTHALSTSLDLSILFPDTHISTTGYCLANPGKEYLVFQPGLDSFNVDLSEAPGQYMAHWSDIEAGNPIPAETVPGGQKHTFQAPFRAPSVLHLLLK